MTWEEPSLETLWLKNIEMMDKFQITVAVMQGIV
jgi:hypothetical protein